MTVSAFLDSVSSVFAAILGTVQMVLVTISGNPLLYVPVLIALFGGIVIFAIGIIRRFGVRGVSSTGRRRRR